MDWRRIWRQDIGADHDDKGRWGHMKFAQASQQIDVHKASIPVCFTCVRNIVFQHKIKFCVDAERMVCFPCVCLYFICVSFKIIQECTLLSSTLLGVMIVTYEYTGTCTREHVGMSHFKNVCKPLSNNPTNKLWFRRVRLITFKLWVLRLGY